jgi:hypothetical protein
VGGRRSDRDVAVDRDVLRLAAGAGIQHPVELMQRADPAIRLHAPHARAAEAVLRALDPDEPIAGENRAGQEALVRDEAAGAGAGRHHERECHRQRTRGPPAHEGHATPG